jgi:hypothetical protein
VYMVGGVKGVQFTFEHTQSNHFENFIASSTVAWNGFQIKPCATPTTAIINTLTQSPNKQKEAQPKPADVISEFKKLLLRERAARELKIKVSEVASPESIVEEGEEEVVVQQHNIERPQEKQPTKPTDKPNQKRGRQTTNTTTTTTNTNTSLITTNSNGEGARKRVLRPRSTDTRMDVVNVNDDDGEERKDERGGGWLVVGGRRGGARSESKGGGNGRATGGVSGRGRESAANRLGGRIAREQSLLPFVSTNRHTLPG